MNAGPAGFGYAPVTKGLILATIGSTVVANAARASHRQLPQPLVLSSRGLAFRSPGELLFGCLLLYYFRVLERQTGSAKFGSYAAVVTGLSYALQLACSGVLHIKGALAPGPLPLVFASFIPFVLDIPASSHFTVLGGCTLSDKAFVYLAGLQLLLISGRKSLMVLFASTVAGVLYRVNVCNIRRLRLPAALVRAVSKVLGPLLSDPPGPSIMMAGTSQAAAGGPAAAAGAGYGRAGGGARHAGNPAQAAPGLRHRAGAAAAAAGAAGAAAGGLAAAAPPPSAEAVDTLVQMGFDRQQATQALQQAGNDVQAAVMLLLGQHH